MLLFNKWRTTKWFSRIYFKQKPQIAKSLFSIKIVINNNINNNSIFSGIRFKKKRKKQTNKNKLIASTQNWIDIAKLQQQQQQQRKLTSFLNEL